MQEQQLVQLAHAPEELPTEIGADHFRRRISEFIERIRVPGRRASPPPR